MTPSGETREAGRELDSIIAQRLFGYRWWENSANGCCYLLSESPRRSRNEATNAIWTECRVRPSDYESRWYDGGLPRYSTDVGSAWLVVEKMREDGFYPNVFVDDTGEVSEPVAWFCECDPNWRAEAFTSRASTAPLAICIAALKAYAARATLSEKTEENANG